MFCRPTFLFFIGLFLGSSALAQVQCDQVYRAPSVHNQVLRIMAQMKSNGTYEPDFCNTNAFTLVELMQNSGLNISKTEVLYLLPFKGEDFVFFPKKSVHPVDSWDLHVVVRHQGIIYDLDYAGRPVELPLYLNRMFEIRDWGEGEAMIRSIPAREYIRDYQDHRYVMRTSLYESAEPVKDFYYYMHLAEEYPLRTPLDSF